MEATNAGGPLRGGIDLGGTKIEAIVVDAGHTVLGSSRHPTPSSGGPEAVAAELVAAMRAACQAAGTEPSALQGVGVGSPGVVDEATGTVSTARNLPDWEGSFELGPALSRELGTMATLGNDVQVATDAEFELGGNRLRTAARRRRMSRGAQHGLPGVHDDRFDLGPAEVDPASELPVRTCGLHVSEIFPDRAGR